MGMTEPISRLELEHDAAVLRDGERLLFWQVMQRHLTDERAKIDRILDDERITDPGQVAIHRGIRIGINRALDLPHKVQERAKA